MKIMLRKIIYTLFVSVLLIQFASAQEQRDLNKEVEVRSAYQPKINKAKRLGELPVVVDTAKFTPSFQYFVKTKPLTVGFSPSQIPAAKMLGEPLKKINSHSLTLAGGNYATLFGDYRFNNQRSKDLDIGVHLRHYSTNGKVTLENGDEEKPDWTEQLAEVYGTFYMDEGKVNGRVFYERNAYNFYGFPQEGDVDNSWENLFPYAEQKLNNFGLSADYQTTFKNEEKLNFGLGLKYEHFSDDIDVKQNDISIEANARIRRGDGFWSLGSKFDYFSVDGLLNSMEENVADRKSFVWTLSPRYQLQTGKLNLQLGVKPVIAFGDDSETKLYPDIKIDVEVIDDIMSLYAGLDGNLKINTFKELVYENSFIASGLNIEPSNQKYRLFGGMRGSLSKSSSFNLSVEYSNIENQYFFRRYEIFPGITDGFTPKYSNKFAVVADDISLLRIGAEVNLDWNEKLDISSKFTYTHYSLDKLKEAWHMPNFEMNVDARYRFTEDLSFQAGVNVLGQRPVLYQGEKRDLDAVYDVNVGANYSLMDNITAFGKINNLFADKYYHWNGYPSQRLNFLLGIKMVF